MPLLIDGYNLMHAAGVIPPGRGPGGLERSRGALVRFLADALSDAERRGATIVFDAAGAPPGLPQTMYVDDVLVRFAKGYPNADELIEELIDADTAPRRLTVVSSDHRVQRAAKRRRATAVDSDVWYEQVVQAKRAASREARESAAAARQPPTVSNAEVLFWLNRLLDDPEIRAAPDWQDIFPPGYGDDVIDKDADES